MDLRPQLTSMDFSSEACSFRLGLMDVLHAPTRKHPSGHRGELQADISGRGFRSGKNAQFPPWMHLSM
jgi:hypothetical protein